MEYFLCFIYAILFIGIIYKAPFFNIPSLSKKLISSIFLLKIGVGFALSLIYTYYYTDRNTADIFKYFDESKTLYDSLWSNPVDFFKMLFNFNSNTDYYRSHYFIKMNSWFNESLYNQYSGSITIIKINALMRMFSFGYFSIHNLFFCFISLIGLTALYKAFAPFFKYKKIVLIGVFLIPSVLLWGSGILKESVLLLGIGLFVLTLLKIAHQRLKTKYIIALILSMLTLVLIKPYLLILLLPVSISYIWVSKTDYKHLFFKYSIVITIGLVFALNISHLLPQYNILKSITQQRANIIDKAKGGVFLINDSLNVFIADNQRNQLIKIDSLHVKINQGSSYLSWNKKTFKDSALVKNSTDTSTFTVKFDYKKAGSLISSKQLNPTFTSFIIELPRALINCLIQPLLFTSFSPFMIMASIENLIFILLIIMMFIYPKSLSKAVLNLVFFCLFFTLFTYLLVGWSTPIIGAIVRYKSPSLPFFFIGLFLLIDIEKLQKKIKKIVKWSR